AGAGGPVEATGPRAHNVASVRERAKGPGRVLTTSPAIHLAAHPELAAPPASAAPAAAKPEAKAATPKAPAPEAVQQKAPAARPALPSLMQSLSKVVSPLLSKDKIEGPVLLPAPAALPATSPNEVPPLTRVSAAVPADDAHLDRVIRAACGNLARSVRVETAADGQPIVHVHAAPASEQEIIGKLLAIPEIA